MCAQNTYRHPTRFFDYTSFGVFFSLILFPLILQGQDEIRLKRFHFGIFSQVWASKQVFNQPIAEAMFKPGFAIGAYQYVDLNQRAQLRLGGGLSMFSIDEKDYDAIVSADIDPVTGEINIYNTYIHNKVDIIQLLIPLHIRYRIIGSAKNIFIAGGVEGRIILSDFFEASIQSDGSPLHEFDPKPFYSSRNLLFAGHMELGYEIPLYGSKIHFTVLAKYGLATQIKGKGSAFSGIHQGRTFDIGVGSGLIF